MSTPAHHNTNSSRFMQRRFQVPKDTRPQSACPICYLNAHTPDEGVLLEFRCERGHEWIQTLTVAVSHAAWLARFSTTETRGAG